MKVLNHYLVITILKQNSGINKIEIKMTTYEKFKIGLLTIFFIGFLYCLYGYSENGKYVFHNEYPQIILNSRTVDLYNIRNENKIEIENFKLKK